MSDTAKIEQFQKAVEQDPNDELAQFGLGSALLDAGRAEEAGPCFQRVLAVNSQHSKAHQLLGTVQKLTGHDDLAIQTLTNGYRIAHRKGDLMPMKEMEALLKELGAEVPTVAEKKSGASGAVGDGDFTCRRCGGDGPVLQKAPFKGDLGEVVLASVCNACWQEWVGMGTKVINELRLPMYDPQAQELYDKHMKEFLLID
ncbi:MAG: Fe(2+)-trafficking protein [Phycisphaerales bacterium]|nr:Fe(2+)-trafficking protein [Phycisphaerales bacterium]